MPYGLLAYGFPTEPCRRKKLAKKVLPIEEVVFKFKFWEKKGRHGGQLDELLDASFRLHKETQQEQDAARQAQKELAERRGVEAYRFERFDKTGQPIPDWGTPVFGKEGLRDVKVKLAFDDVRAIPGMHVAELDVFQRLNDRDCYFLRLTIAKSETRHPIAPTAVQWILIRDYMGKVWGYVHVWRNLYGANVNIVCASIRNLKDVFDVQDLRILNEGRHMMGRLQADEVEFV